MVIEAMPSKIQILDHLLLLKRGVESKTQEVIPLTVDVGFRSSVFVTVKNRRQKSGPENRSCIAVTVSPVAHAKASKGYQCLYWGNRDRPIHRICDAGEECRFHNTTLEATAFNLWSDNI